jgi:hypothetical protein
MNATVQPSTLSVEAKGRMLKHRGEPFFLAGWHDAVFLHFAVKPELLQPFVPFELDVFDDDMAYVSCVAFTMRDLRPRVGGAWLFKPIATHEFLNVRAYVKHRGVKGIYFLAEWLPNKLSVFLGPTVFGLPYRLGVNQYDHDANSIMSGLVRDRMSGATLRYEAEPVETKPSVCEHGTLDEFLVERYTAFTTFLGIKRCFHVWHPSWQCVPLDARVADTSLLRCTGAWADHAKLIGAHFAKGFNEVWMGRPRLVEQ